MFLKLTTSQDYQSMCLAVVVNLYLYTAVVWGGDQGAVHYAFYVSTKSGWGWSVRRENLGVGLWPTGRLTNVGRGAYVTTLLLSTETDGCIVQHIHWGPEGRRPKAVHVGAKPPIHAGAGFSADRRRVWSSGPKAGVWSCGSSVLGSQGVVIISKLRQSSDSNPRLPPVRRGSGGARYYFATTPPSWVHVVIVAT